jgi:hypothetical protein
MLDAVGIEDLSRLFVTSPTKKIHYTNLNVAIAT